MNYNQISKEIIENIGGSENVTNLSHCMTRLRFVLKDESKVNKEAVEKIEGVLGSAFGAGQYQIIAGKNLAPMFDSLNQLYHFADHGESAVPKTKEPLTLKSALMGILNFMSGSVSPVITGLVAGGLLKLVLYLLTLINAEVTSAGAYQLVNMLADVPFYFMPLFVAFGASRKLNCSPVLPMILAAALISPNFLAMEGPVSLFGLKVPVLKYASTAIPAMLSTLSVYWFEKLFNRIIPGILRNTIVAPLTLIASFILTFTLLAPLGNYLGNYVVGALVWLQNTAGPLALTAWTTLLPFMIMAGMHTLVAPFMLENINSLGYDSLFRPGLLLGLLAQGGAAFGIALASKEKTQKADAVSVGVSSIFAGISEPAIFGIMMKYKSALYGVLAGSLAGGFISGLFKVKAYVITKNTILALPVFQDTMIQMGIGCLVTAAVAMAVTYIVEKRNQTETTDIILPVTEGKQIPIESVNDETFAQKMMGDGTAFIPDSNVIRAPFAGTVSAVFPTGHAYGITRADGVEVLIHIGIDTVNFNGKGFDAKVKQGDHVKAGQTLCVLDLEYLKSQNADLTTMLVFTNTAGKEIQWENSREAVARI